MRISSIEETEIVTERKLGEDNFLFNMFSLKIHGKRHLISGSTIMAKFVIASGSFSVLYQLPRWYRVIGFSF